MAKGEFREGEYGLYNFSLYSKVWPRSKPPFQKNSFSIYCPSDEDAFWLETLLCDGERSEDEEYFAIANRARFGVKRYIYRPTEEDYQLPAGFSPSDMKWVSCNLNVTDAQGWDKGGRSITFPGVLDVEELVHRLKNGGFHHMLIRCWDGVYREPTDMNIIKVDSYRV